MQTITSIWGSAFGNACSVFAMPEPRTAAANKNKRLSTADCAEQNKAWLLAHNTQQCLWGGRGGGFTNMAWWHGPEITAGNSADHFPACSQLF